MTSNLGIARAPDILQGCLNLRQKRNTYRKILDEQIPRLAAMEKLLPSIFDLGTLAGAANRQILITALKEGDADALQLLIESHRPAYDAQRQLEEDKKRLRRPTKGDLQ